MVNLEPERSLASEAFVSPVLPPKTAVLHNDDHVLRYILPDRRNHSYCLRPKRHELTLAIRRDSRNCFQILLFKGMY